MKRGELITQHVIMMIIIALFLIAMLFIANNMRCAITGGFLC